jgi:hypothetical protein
MIHFHLVEIHWENYIIKELLKIHCVCMEL